MTGNTQPLKWGVVVHDYNPSILEVEAEDGEFEVSLDYLERPDLRKKHNK
jgi:hypothetical protein